MAHLPFVVRSPFCQTADAADVRPDTCKRQIGRVRSERGWLVSCDGYDGPPKNGGGHGSQRTRRGSERDSDEAGSEAILGRCEWNGFTAPREPIQGHVRFLPKGEAASGGAGRAGAVSAGGGGPGGGGGRAGGGRPCAPPQ